MGFPGGSVVKNLPANAGDIGEAGSISGLGKSPAEENGNPLQYSFLENSRDRGSWQVAKSQIRLSNQHTQRLFLSRGSIALGPCLPYPENGRGKRTRGREPTLLKDPEEAEMPLARTWSHDHTQMQGRLGNVLQLCTWLQSSFFFFNSSYQVF